MEKEKLIKGLFYITIIIVLTTAASKLLFGRGETLQDYAQKNPEVTYSKEKKSETEPEMEPDITKPETEFDITKPEIESDMADSDTQKLTEAKPLIPADRIIYQEDFYYEPLNEEMKERITGSSFPKPDSACEITYDDLRYLHILHYNFDGEVTKGELICNKAIAQDLVQIFYELYKAEYQLEKIRLIDEYDGDDDASMADNNTSCFNYRVVEGTEKLSQHAYGMAVDINPFYNPYVRYNKDGSLHIDPAGSEAYADRSVAFPYKIDENDLCLKLFKEHGFTWGGDWNSMKDYQHFQKTRE